MRLLGVETIELKWFNDNEVPEYAILSHTWGADEISYQELLWINHIKAFSTQANSQASSVASLSSQNEQSGFLLMAMGMMTGISHPGSSFGSIDQDGFLNKRGYSKIINAAREARNLGFDYIW